MKQVPLSDLVAIRRGQQLKEEDRRAGHVPVVTASREQRGTHSVANFTGPSVTLSSHGAVGQVLYWPEPIWLANNVFLLEPKTDELLPRFLYHLLKSRESDLRALAQVGGIPYVNARDILSMRVPMVPIREQWQIIEILDRFTDLDAELEAELEARRAQHANYRSVLLALGPEVSRAPMGELCIIKSGQPISKVEIAKNTGGYPVINSGRDPLGYIDRFNTIDDPIGITSRGAGVGSVIWTEGAYFRGNLNYSATIRDVEVLQVRFLYHWLLHDQRKIQSLCTHDGIPALNKSNLEKLRIPIPPPEVQTRIAETLDTFDALVNSPTIGLPAELAARRKQYEYYRDKLLTFEEAPA